MCIGVVLPMTSWAQCSVFSGSTYNLRGDLTLSNCNVDLGTDLEIISYVNNSTDMHAFNVDGEVTINVKEKLLFESDYTEECKNGTCIDVPNSGTNININNNSKLIVKGDLEISVLTNINIVGNGQLIVLGDLIVSNRFAGRSLINLNNNSRIYVRGDGYYNYSNGTINGEVFTQGQVIIERIDTVGQSSYQLALDWLKKNTDLGILRYLVAIFIQGQFEAIQGENNSDFRNSINNNLTTNLFDLLLDISDPFTASNININGETLDQTQLIFNSTEEQELLDQANYISSSDYSWMRKEVVLSSSFFDDINSDFGFTSEETDDINDVRSLLSTLSWSFTNNFSYKGGNQIRLLDLLMNVVEGSNDISDEDRQKLKDLFADPDMSLTVSIFDKGKTKNFYTTNGISYPEFDIQFNHQITDDDLPVELISFTAEKINNDVELNWATASEKNASHFIVQKSYDRSNWLEIGEVKAFGNSNTRHDYKYTDNNSYNDVYYRLKQVDFDGQSEFFGPLFVAFGNERKFNVVLMPNNTTIGDQVKVSISGINTNQDVAYQLFDTNGRLIHSDVIQSTGNTSLLEELEYPNQIGKGMYYLIFQNGSSIERKKILFK